MKSQSFCLQLTTKKAPDFIDITAWVSECVAKSEVNNGFAVVYSKHTTAAIKINENEPLLLQDMAKFLEQFSPRSGKYRHNDFSVRTVNMTPDESPNGHATYSIYCLEPARLSRSLTAPCSLAATRASFSSSWTTPGGER